MNYGYRSIRTTVPGIAGTIARGNVKSMQRKGQRWSHLRNVDIIINRVDGNVSHITVLDKDGKALARLSPDALF